MATKAAKKTQKAQVAKIVQYEYHGVDKKGKKLKGDISAPSITVAKAELRRQGVITKRIKKKPKPLFGGKQQKITPSDVCIFTRQLATMMKSGVPLVQAFEITAEGLENQSMRKLLLELKTEVEGGNSLENALRRHPKYFDDLFCSLVGAGEQAGALETMLDRVATYQEKSEALKMKIKKAMKYPIAVVCVALIVTVILLVKVVPTFEELFEGFGAELPAFTKFVMSLSEWMQANWYMVIGFFIAVPFTIKYCLRKFPGFRDAVDKGMLKAPVVGDILFKSTIARFARTLATTFAAGVPLVEALESVEGATGNIVYKRAVANIREEVASGTQLQFAMRQTGVFPSMAIQMTAIGEESGALDAMLEKVATYYEDEVDNAVDGLTSLMEPIIMSVLGVLVGGLIIAMYLPIFQMGKAVG
ncbi:MAG: type II secretion system F family protein [Pseudomonadota bacterium]|nr:type II secretion system protein F [Gammaproteobacteria bacterium]MEC8011427.1 type II secretion system F family protein [Pseudomonadota bacterium]HBF06657.1 type II secretion system protein F [Gammaproteobacteria bacterium]|tara:strand:+ start:129222 stop:130472 length:1251 start_codon:yes stop_codon:yes gene_type:complete